MVVAKNIIANTGKNMFVVIARDEPIIKKIITEVTTTLKVL